MGEISGGGCSLKNHTIYQYYFDSNNSDVISGCVFLNSHTISQCEDSSTLNNIDDNFEKGDGGVISGFFFLTATLSPNVNI